jgi:hypothetical protein
VLLVGTRMDENLAKLKPIKVDQGEKFICKTGRRRKARTIWRDGAGGGQRSKTGPRAFESGVDAIALPPQSKIASGKPISPGRICRIQRGHMVHGGFFWAHTCVMHNIRGRERGGGRYPYAGQPNFAINSMETGCPVATVPLHSRP